MPLRPLELSCARPKEAFKVQDILCDQVGERSFEQTPNKFVRVEFGCIARKEVGMKPGRAAQESLNQLRAVSLASVPQENDGARNMPSQRSQKLTDLKGANIFVGMETDIKRCSFSFGADRNGGDCRYLRPVSGHTHDRSLASGRPGFGNVGDQKEAAFVEERQTSPQSF